MRFTAGVEATGKTTTGIEVPGEVVEGLGGGRRAKLLVTINSETFATSLGSMGGRPMISMSAERRELTGVAAGDRVEVELALDTSVRTIAVPDELAAALAADPAAAAAFESLSNSRKQRLTDPIERGKAPETRARNVDKAMRALRGE